MTRIRIIIGLLLVSAVLFVGQAAIATDSNQVDFWCETGVKFEPVSTPYVVPTPPAGATWTLLVLKAGTENDQIPNPVVGNAYSHSSGRDISHVILCYEEVPPSTTTTTTTLPTTTSTTTSTTTPPDTTTTTEPPTTSTTTSTSTTTTLPEPTTTTVPPDPSTTTTSEVPPPTYIESGDAGYIDEVDHEHDNSPIDLIVGGLVIAGLMALAYAYGRNIRK